MKKLISMLLTVMLVLSLTPSAFATTFVPGKTADELTSEELLENLTTWVWWESRSTKAEELTTEQLRQVYQWYLDEFNQYLAVDKDWLSKLENTGTYVEVGPASKFTDVPQDAWYLNELHYAVGNGYISGTGATTFSPSNPITRGQFVTILGRMLGVDATNGATKFTDVPKNEYYAPYVGWAADNGIVNGTSPTTFAPNNNITFEQMGTILANYIIKFGVSLKEVSGVQYADASKISGYAASNMELMRKYGLITPDANGNVNPQNAVTRADGAVSLVRLTRGMGLGKEPTTEKQFVSVDTSNMKDSEIAELKAQQVHDELWAAGAITSSMTEKEKAIVYFKWMSIFSTYHESALYPKRHAAYGALVDGVGVCDGLTYAYNMLLRTENIRCSAPRTSTHMWCEAYLDGEWYHIETVDITHGNPDGSYSVAVNNMYISKSFDTPISGPTYEDA